MPEVGVLYKQWKPDGDYDAIVIGSGMGGLATAALLAQHAGKRVLVLERHTTAGGFTHVFRRKGYEWDVGVHYIGSVHRDESFLRTLFDRISGGGLEWEDMGDVVDTVIVGDRRVEYLAGREAWRQRMHAEFPDQADAIDHYMEMVDEVTQRTRTFFASKALPPAIGPVAGPLMRRGFLRLSDRTLGDVLDGLTSNQMLKAVLAAQFGDHGMPPSRASFAIHAMIFRHYLGGGAYPVGGSSRIAATVAPQIESAGGQIVLGAEVATILIGDGRKAEGVELVDGRTLSAPIVISDAGVPNTARKLLPEGAPGRDRLIATVNRIGRSACHLCLYVGIRQTAEQLGLGRSNLWVYPDADQDAAIDAYMDDPSAPIPLAYISFPSAKDPDFERRFPGRATVEVVSLANYDWFKPWEDKPWLKRGEDYDRLKERLSDRLLDILIREVPQLDGVIDYHELSTPISTRHFADYDQGEIYGLEHSPARFRETALQPRTPLKGFYLTGQDVCTAGVAGALFGAVVATSAVLGRDIVKDIMTSSHPTRQ